ncbi:hypothetical protein GCM10029963_33490 [Micromonospora andamanensis]|uniref:hypothetical protein n=1 Tax=Micromonospora andamanensis TaxID=1287068 RepID=UPI00194FD33B|nr:hypothetical protein [Micromonospora andamanensis]GIJ42807.1 hypothetical protein Vwe01_61320 [Micromonospora andamanensis]
MIRSSRIPALLAVVFTAGLLGACAATTPQPRPQPSAASSPQLVDPSVNYHDPHAVCAAFAVAAHRVDTAVDRDRADAYRRAAMYLDARLAAAAVDQDSARQTPQWQELVHHRAYTDVQFGPYAGDALPPDTAEQRHVGALVTVQPIGRDGWRGTLERHTVVCGLRPSTDGWRISEYEIG